MDATAMPAGLADRLGPEATLELVGLLDRSQRECLELTITQSTDRFERRLVEETSKLHFEMGVLRLEMRDGFARTDQNMGTLRLEMREGFGAIRQEMAAHKFDLLKWSFVFWIGQMVGVAGIVGTMLR